jgi:hypothetical protein
VDLGAKFGAQIANMLLLDVMKKALRLFFALLGIKIYLGKYLCSIHVVQLKNNRIKHLMVKHLLFFDFFD